MNLEKGCGGGDGGGGDGDGGGGQVWVLWEGGGVVRFSCIFWGRGGKNLMKTH